MTTINGHGSAINGHASARLTRSPGVKFFVLGLLALLILIPLLFVEQLQRERSTRAGEAMREVGRSWGGDQTIAGPYLMLPYLVEGAAGAPAQRRVAVFLPDQFKADGRAETQILRRSIFDVAVYRGKFDLAARFKPPSLNEVDAQASRPLWDEAALAMQISDVRGVKNRVALKISDGALIEFRSTTGPLGTSTPGIHAPLRGVDLSKALDVSIALDLNGSRGLAISPIGAQSEIALQSNWKHPSFSGAQLPDERSVGERGFSAQWRISQLSRNLDQAFQFRQGVTESSFVTNAVSVRFYQPVDIYQMAARATKYGVLFVGAVFLVVFALEMLSGGYLHVAQYSMVGLALALFYVLLLSYAEHIGFTRAYLLSAQTETLTLQNLMVASPDQPPALAAPTSAVAIIGNESTFVVTANDLGSGVALDLKAEGLPATAQFNVTHETNNSTRGTFRWTPTAADAGKTWRVTFTVSDGQLADARTTTLRLGTSIMLLPAAHPLRVAEEVATLDRLSNGRVTLGVGFGWNLDELGDHNVPPGRRRTMLREYLEAMRALWTDEEAEYHGEFVDFGTSWAWPKPPQGLIPTLVGAAGNEKNFKWIARSADGWITTPGEADIEGSVELLKKTWAEAGREGDPQIVVLDFRPDPEKLERWREIGVTTVLYGLPDDSVEKASAYLAKLAGKLGIAPAVV